MLTDDAREPDVSAMGPLKQALKHALRGFFPTWKWTVLLLTCLHFLVAVALLIAGEIHLLAVVLAPVGGALFGAVVGVFSGLVACVYRFGGKMAFLPLVVLPLCVALALWLCSGWVGTAWADASTWTASSKDGSKKIRLIQPLAASHPNPPSPRMSVRFSSVSIGCPS